jgi:hypothetical protein
MMTCIKLIFCKFLQSLLKSQPGNVLVSPLGAKLLLTLLAEAAGQTLESKTRRVNHQYCIVLCTILFLMFVALLGTGTSFALQYESL